MNLQDMFEQVDEIIGGLFLPGSSGSARIKVTKENRALIEELQMCCAVNDMLDWHVIGSVKTKTAYFVIRAKQPESTTSGQVIFVDFKKRCVIGRQAA